MTRGNCAIALEHVASALAERRDAAPGFMADHLRTLAADLGAQERHEEAGQPFGAERQMWSELGVARPPVGLNAQLREATARTREALGAVQFASLCEVGAGWHGDEAIDRALEIAGLPAPQGD